MSAPQELLAPVLDKTHRLLEGVQPDQADLPTPCTEFDVAALQQHIAYWAEYFAESSEGGAPGTPERTSSDPAGDFSACAERIVKAFRDGAGGQELNMMMGPMPGRSVAGMILMEYVGHGWDLATATGQPVPYTDEEAAAALEFAHGMLKPEYRGPDKMIGDEVAVPADAPALDRLIGFLGRQP